MEATNMSTLDTRTEDERQADAELATMVRLETRSQTFRRAGLESELAEAAAAGDAQLARAIRREIDTCDLALVTLAAGRLPRVL
jgi:hypothetical protein